MKTTKLVTGILSIVLFAVVSFQSCAAGLGNTLSESGEISGSAGFIVAICLLTGGIVSIATRNGKKGGNIACTILYGIGAILAISLAGSFSDLKIWGGYSLICAIIHIVANVKSKNA